MQRKRLEKKKDFSKKSGQVEIADSNWDKDEFEHCKERMMYYFGKDLELFIFYYSQWICFKNKFVEIQYGKRND